MAIFVALFILSFSFPFQIILNLGGWLEPFFNWMAELTWNLFFTDDYVAYHSAEDSSALLINVINLIVLTFLLFIAFVRIFKNKIEVLGGYSRLLLRYYLALILLIYGFDKIYKWQFYYPESNIMYTKLKDFPQDLLYWSTMGTSYSYSIFAGISEVIPALLLLSRRTAFIGGTLAFAVLLNVFMINIGFDVTVKLYSFFLLMISIVIVMPSFKVVALFFVGRSLQLQLELPNYIRWKAYYYLKILVLLIIFIECQFKYFASWNFNDDNFPRPKLNGAYQVISSESEDLVRIHFHRNGYLILESNKSEFQDYKMNLSGENILLMDYDLKEFVLKYENLGDTLFMYGTNGFFIQAIKIRN